MSELDPAARAPRAPRARLIGALVAASALIGAGGINAIAMSTANPLLLKALAPYSGAASSIWTELAVQTTQTAPNMDELRRKAISTLSREPLDFRAARTIALTDLAEGRKAEARKLFRIIARNTQREPITHVWLIGDAFKNRRYGDLLREAEIVMRDQPDSAVSVFTMLTTFIDEGKIVDAIVRKVAARPEWRAGFFDVFGERSKNSAAAYDFFRRVKAAGAPASAAEQRVWLLHEIGRTDTSEVVARWKALQAVPLPPSERFVRNPGFEGSAAPQPFNWAFFLPDGSFAEITSTPDGEGKALYVEMTGRDNMTVARQILDLAPGSYMLSYRAFPLAELERQDLRIGIDCAQGKTFSPRFDHAVTGARETWSRRSVRFTLPAGCDAQQLTIGMRPGGLTANLQAYFDDFSIKPVARGAS